MSQDLVPLEAQDLVVSRPPEIVLEEARRAAVALKDVIDRKPNPVVFNNEKYLEFEDWQTVGRFYGISPKIVSTAFVQYGKAEGWEAKAEAVHVASGRVASAAEAMCLNDEEKWRARPKYEWHYVKKSGGTSKDDPGKDELIWEKGKDNKSRPKKERVLLGDEAVPLFQLRSMAQTRACAKAMRNALAWVVVLAGFKATPAEEIDGAIHSHAKLHGKDVVDAEVVTEDEDITERIPGAGAPISAEQAAVLRNDLLAAGKKAEEDTLRIAKVSRVEDILAVDYDEIMKALAKRRAKAAA